MKVLVIEDNDILRDNIVTYLDIKGYKAKGHADYHGAMLEVVNYKPDVIILDLGLGSEEGDGRDICRALREKGDSTPILILTARSLTEQKIEGLNIGADDYMVKPFDYNELIARLEALVRRSMGQKGQIVRVGDIIIDTSSHQVKLSESEVRLSKLEYELFLYMARNIGRALTKQELLEKVWGEYDAFEESRTVDIHIGYLRKKIGAEIIETMRGVGYIIPDTYRHE
ncbi:response regulator transcription factor [Candidatus Gracilibacteria bacterium]|nr:response regulator transcription factor [Candidatus Gracilibacteria bacterium]